MSLMMAGHTQATDELQLCTAASL